MVSDSAPVPEDKSKLIDEANAEVARAADAYRFAKNDEAAARAKREVAWRQLEVAQRAREKLLKS
jgi:hypothetical protein